VPLPLPAFLFAPFLPIAMKQPSSPSRRAGRSLLLSCALGLLAASPGWAAEPAKPAPAPSGKEIADQVRAALEGKNPSQKSLPLVIDSKEKKLVAAPLTVRTPPPPQVDPQYHRARTLALTGRLPPVVIKSEPERDLPWSYEGEGGPQAWGKLKPEFNLCALGKRQSPIHIEDNFTLQGPAEPIQFSYQPSGGTAVNNGHTIQVDVTSENSITVRSSTFKLVQFHFHNPSEERINQKRFAMVAHLVHRNEQGQLAVVAVLLDPGAANELIHKVWTYLPLDKNDSVHIPAGLLDLNALLPKDQRYYQFMGSLTTPPCTEGVLWLVLKQPGTVSPAQLKLFGQLFPNNARPVQLVHDRPVRDAQ
jgi:carbonic anhydrase